MSHLCSSDPYYPKLYLAHHLTLPKKVQTHFNVFKYQMLSLLSGLSNFQQDIFEIDPSQVLIYLNIVKSSFFTSGKIPRASHASINLLLRAMQRIKGPSLRRETNQFHFELDPGDALAQFCFSPHWQCPLFPLSRVQAECTGTGFHILEGEISGSMNSQLWYEVDQSHDPPRSKENSDLHTSVGWTLSWLKWDTQLEIPSGEGGKKCSKQESNHLAPGNKKSPNSMKKN